MDKMLDRVWDKIQSEIFAAAPVARLKLLEEIEDALVYEPDRALKIISSISASFEAEVPAVAVRILRRICLHESFIIPAANTLWDMGRNDGRSTNSFSDHPIRALTDIASYDIDKPTIVQECILDAIESWLSRDDAFTGMHTPLEVLEPILAKSGHSMRSNARGVTFSPFGVNRAATKQLRDRALALLLKYATFGGASTTRKVLEIANGVLMPANLSFGLELPDDFHHQWHEEIDPALQIVRTIAHASDPVSQLLLHSVFRHRLRFSKDEPLTKQLREAIDSPGTMKSTRIALQMLNTFEYDLDEDDFDPNDFEAAEARAREKRLKGVKEFLELFPDDRRALAEIDGAIKLACDAKLTPEPFSFLHAIGEIDPLRAIRICALTLAASDSLLASYAGPLLAVPRQREARAVLDFIKQLWPAPEIGHRRFLASYLSVAFVGTGIDALEIEILRDLLGDSDSLVQHTGYLALLRLAKAMPALVIELSVTAPIISGVDTFRDRFSALMYALEASSDMLAHWQITKLLELLVDAPDIGEHSIKEFLNVVGKRNPHDVLEIFIRRVHQSEHKSSDTFRPIPYPDSHHEYVSLSHSSDLTTMLRRVADEYQASSNGSNRFWFQMLFQHLSSNFQDDRALSVLTEWINSEKTDYLELVGDLLQRSSDHFIFAHEKFIINLLRKAHAAGPQCSRDIQSSLFGAAISGTRSGAPGAPFERDVKLKADAQRVAATCDLGSAEAHFFEGLVDYSQRRIADQIAEGEELED